MTALERVSPELQQALSRKSFKYSVKRNVHTLVWQGRSYYLVGISIPCMMECLFFRKLYHIFLPTTEKPSSQKLFQEDLFCSALLCWLQAEVPHWCMAFKGAIWHYCMCRVKLWLIQIATRSFRMMEQNQTLPFALDQLSELTRSCVTWVCLLALLLWSLKVITDLLNISNLFTLVPRYPPGCRARTLECKTSFLWAHMNKVIYRSLYHSITEC